MNYYLGPYQWIDNSWQPPATTVGSIDLRNLSHMGTPVIQNGVGFFATTDVLSGYTLLGRGDLREINSTSLMKSAWNSLLGYSPNGDKLVDLLYDQLTMGADPTGTDGPRPLMPSPNNLQLNLANHSMVKGKQFRIGHSPETNKVLSVYKEDYRQIRQDVLDFKLPIDHHRKVLDFWGKQFKIKNPENIFIPKDLPKETRVPHSTTLSDNFDGANNAALGKQITWVEGGGGGEWDNFNNHGRKLGFNNNFDQIVARTNSAFSSADQSSDGELIAGIFNTSEMGVTVRASSSEVTYYYANMKNIDGGDANFQLFKVIVSVRTELATGIFSVSFPGNIKLEIMGSSLKLFYNDVENLSDTDTAITGNLFCGLQAFNRSGGNEIEFDNWIGEDITGFSGGNTGAPFLLGLLQ